MEASITIREITATDFPVITRLFGPVGACNGCWCMFWRMRSFKWHLRGQGEAHRLAFQELVEQGKVHAAIAFEGSEPVGWVTYGPRGSFPRVAYSRELKRIAPEGTWSIVCFYIPQQWRGKGVANQLLDAAVGYCKAHGAVEIEAFPIEVPDSSIPRLVTDIYTGVTSQFVKAGFQLIPRMEKQRAIYVKRSYSHP